MKKDAPSEPVWHSLQLDNGGSKTLLLTMLVVLRHQTLRKNEEELDPCKRFVGDVDLPESVLIRL